MFNLKPIKRTLRNAGFVLDDFATHIDKKELSLRCSKENGKYETNASYALILLL